jgi:hypothetical protein
LSIGGIELFDYTRTPPPAPSVPGAPPTGGVDAFAAPEPMLPPTPSAPSDFQPFPGVPSPDGMPGMFWPSPPNDPTGGGRAAPVTSTEAVADLATRCLDLQAEIEIAEADLGEMKALTAQGLAPSGDTRRAGVKLNTLKKKLAMAQRLVDGEMHATKLELAWLDRKRGEVDPTEQLRVEMQLHRAKMRLEALAEAKTAPAAEPVQRPMK